MRTPTHQRPFILGVAGGTGSGKTTVSRRIHEALGGSHIAYLQHDSYYYDHSHMSPEERAAYNYDHPDSLDTDLLISHVHALLKWQPVDVPVYDFASHTRQEETIQVNPASIILLEGILIFVEPRLRELMDLRIYVDTDADIRFIRRLHRDVNERAHARIRGQPVPNHRPPHAPGVRRTEQAVCRCHHSRRRRQPSRHGDDRQPLLAVIGAT